MTDDETKDTTGSADATGAGSTDGIGSTGSTNEHEDERDGGNVRASLDRVLSHCESHGEVYVGAIDDYKRIREAMTGEDASDRRPAPEPRTTRRHR